MPRKTTITIETDSLLIVRGRNLPRAWCPICAAESEMIALSNAAVISNLDRIAVEEWLNSRNSIALSPSMAQISSASTHCWPVCETETPTEPRPRRGRQNLKETI